MRLRLQTSCLILLLVTFLSACHFAGQEASANAWPGVPDSLAAHMQGPYSGQFKNGLLTLVINYVSGNTVSGYDLHKGQRRNVNGRIEEKEGQYSLVLKEPGGSPFDGTFYLSLDKDAWKITGKWVPADSSKIKPGLLSLKKNTDSAGDNDNYNFAWQGALGTLTFNPNGSCTLEYYPHGAGENKDSVDSNAQLVTIRGNYQKQADTFRIEWQNNTHTPALRMKLVRQPRIQSDNDSLFRPERLRGNGVEFGIMAD